jgi:malectin (di-glucose binding ER protein)
VEDTRKSFKMLREKPMSAVPDRDQCKAELAAVIASGIFAKAPSLALLLDYVCTKYFEGQANQIKEYNIAVEALGRPPSFEPRQDSIVRVEAFRLRKRLKQYYENEGADRHLRIVIPSGQYVPQFLENGRSANHGDAPDAGPDSGDDELALALEAAPPAAPLAIVPAQPIAVPSTIARPRGPSWVRLAVLVVVPLMVVALAIAVWYSRAHPWAKVGVPKAASAPLGAESEEIRIRSGSSTARYVDQAGNIWSSDRFFRGGSVFATPGHAISATPDPELFRTRREGDFTYDIPLKPGAYELHLYFAETLFGEANTAGGAESSRVFRVLINDEPGLWVFDVISDAGGSSTADEKVFKDISPAKDGKLHLHFAALFKETPFLNAIEIVPGIPGRMHPVRILAGGHSYTDRRGVVWGADRYFSHGSTVARSEPVSNTPDPEIFAAERFGNFTYTIPAADGRYTINLKFAEAWFGPGKPGGGGVGSRVFDVYCNGISLLRNFDIFRAADGAQRAIEKSFHGIIPNAQGKIVLSFVPVVNYACVNAIEVVDDSP